MSDRLHGSGPEPFDACPDGGRCWHKCPGTSEDGEKGKPCWRVLNAEPFTRAYPDEEKQGRWPGTVLREHADAAAEPIDEEEPVPAHPRWVWDCPKCEEQVVSEFAPPADDECDACGHKVRTEAR